MQFIGLLSGLSQRVIDIVPVRQAAMPSEYSDTVSVKPWLHVKFIK